MVLRNANLATNANKEQLCQVLNICLPLIINRGIGHYNTHIRLFNLGLLGDIMESSQVDSLVKRMKLSK